MEEVKKAKEVVENEVVNEDDVVLNEDNEEVRSLYTVIPDVTVTRKTTNKGGKKYSDYFFNCTLRGVAMQVRVRPGKTEDRFADVSAYALLDMVFGQNDTVDFAVRITKRRDFATGRSASTVSYYAYVRDEIEGDFAAPLRFETASDKAIVVKAVELANKKHQLGLNV
ncbi:MAG: hypothetical protein J1G38_04480 [Clostridiales bacterium]|nr:hypothetical protein [Clostridiales bacterium]